MIDAAPRDIRDVQQSVDAAEVNKRAVIGDIFDHTVEYLAFLEAGDQLGALFGAAFLEYGAARNDDIAARAIHLEDLERLWRAHQWGHVADWSNIYLATWQECHCALQVDGEATFHATEDNAVHTLGLLERFLEFRPGFLAAGFLARQNGFAIFVFHPLEEDLDGIADR